MKIKKLPLLVILAMVVTLLAGCAKADAAEQAPETTPQGAEATAAPEAADEPSAPVQEAAADLSTPVAVDQACVDLVYSAPDGQSLIDRIESRNGLHTLEHAESIGLGSRTYELVSIDA